MNRAAVVVLVALLALSLPMSVAGAQFGPPAEPAAGGETGPEVAHGSAASSSPTTSDRDDVLHQSVVLRQLPDRPGEFEAEVTVEVPDKVGSLEIGVPDRATVDSTDGFDRTDGGYEWDETTDDPVVRLVVDANVTGIVRHEPAALESRSPAVSGPPSNSLAHEHDHEDGYSFVETGSWGVVQVPQLRMSWRQSAPVRTDRSVTVDGPGAASDAIAYFGEVTEYDRTVRGETIRLVVPEAADLAESPADVLEALAYASDALAVEARNEEVVMFAVPADDVPLGPRGLQYGGSDAWVAADARLDALSHVWFHEYVHTRQAFVRSAGGPTAEAMWLTEAQAEYHAALLALEAGHTEYIEFRRFLEAGTRSPYGDDVLADPASWSNDRTDYVKGPLVYGAIDRQLRLESDGEYAMTDVFRELNLREERVDREAFLSALEERGGPEVRAFAERYTETTDVPGSWNRFEHAAAFDQPAPQFHYGLGDGPVELSGEAREHQFAPGDRLELVTNETLRFPTTVENRGDRRGTYDAVVTADGTIADRAGGSLEAGATAGETLSWTPTEPGSYDLRVGDDRLTAVVREPAEVTVTGLSAEPTRVDPGEPVTVTATVENRADRPAESTLEFRTADGVVAEQRVALAAGETSTVEAELRFEEDASHEVAVGGERVTVVVGDGAHVWTHRLTEAAPVVLAVGAVVVLALGAALWLGLRRR